MGRAGVRTVGLILGLSFESMESYAPLNPVEIDPGGDAPTSRVICRTLDQETVWETFLETGWPGVGKLALEAALALKKKGAQALALAGSAGHKVAGEIQTGSGLPLIHLADSLGAGMTRLGLDSLGLLGARFTLSDGHLRDRLKDKWGLKVLVPEPVDIEILQAIIHQELLKGRVEEESRGEVIRILGVLKESGAQAFGLAFSDLGRLIKSKDTPLPLLEATVLHAEALKTMVF